MNIELHLNQISSHNQCNISEKVFISSDFSIHLLIVFLFNNKITAVLLFYKKNETVSTTCNCHYVVLNGITK